MVQAGTVCFLSSLTLEHLNISIPPPLIHRLNLIRSRLHLHMVLNPILSPHILTLASVFLSFGFLKPPHPPNT